MDVITPRLLNILWKNGILPIKNLLDTHTHAASTLTGTLPLSKGGTGATDAATARSKLGLGAAATYPVANNDTTNNAGYLATAQIVYNHGVEIDNLKKSVSDGKSAVASAITEKGVSTAADAAFSTMANNIRSIKQQTGYTLPATTIRMISIGDTDKVSYATLYYPLYGMRHFNITVNTSGMNRFWADIVYTNGTSENLASEAYYNGTIDRDVQNAQYLKIYVQNVNNNANSGQIKLSEFTATA